MTNPLIQNLILKYHLLSSTKDIIFCWLPSHVGISGNEEADKAAKLSLRLQESKVKLPSSDLKPLINKFIHSKWQTSWNATLFNKLYLVKPCLGESPLVQSGAQRGGCTCAVSNWPHQAYSFIPFESGGTTRMCFLCRTSNG